MISRELFEIRERNSESHATDFLTVGSMGHTSQIAMGVALSAPHKKVICLDGDGSFIMHMGSVVVNSSLKAKNLVHIILNNGAHDSVGGQPTVASSHSLSAIASSCGYESVLTVDNEIELIHAMKRIELGDVQLLEVKVKKGARKDLIRPTISPKECKENFMGTI